MGLHLIFNVSSAASSAGLQGAISPQVAVPAAEGQYDNHNDSTRSWGRQRPALDSPTTTVTPGTSVAASSSSAPAPASGSLSTSATAASTLARATAASGTLASAKTTKASAGKSVTAGATTPQAYSGWNVDWSDNFTTPLDQTKWARYGYGGQAPGQGGMGVYQQSNAFTSGGLLNLRTQYANGAWSSAGMSSGDFY